MYKRRLRLGDWIKRILLVSVVLVAAVVIGAKMLAGHRVRSTLDGLVAQTAGLGDLRYLDVSTDFNGHVRIRGLAFYPSELIDMAPLITEETVIITPGMLYLLGLEGGPIPRRLGVSLLGMRVDLADLTGFQGLNGGSLSGNPFEALACGGIESFQSPDLRRMGFSQDLRLDLHMRFEVAADTLQLHLEQSSTELSSFSIDLELTTPGMELALVNRDVDGIKLSKARLELSASEFNRRRNSFCAEEIGGNEEEFLDRNERRALARLQRRGIAPGPVLKEHYRQYMEGQGSWVLEADPKPPVSMQQFIEYDSDQMLEWLAITSSIEGQAPRSVSFEHFEPVAEDRQPEPDEDVESVDQRVITAQRNDPWVEIDVADAARYLDERINLATDTGKNYRGYLVKLSDGALVIETRVPGGDATIPIPLEQVRSLKVRESDLRDDQAAPAEPDDN